MPKPAKKPRTPAKQSRSTARQANTSNFEEHVQRFERQIRRASRVVVAIEEHPVQRQEAERGRKSLSAKERHHIAYQMRLAGKQYPEIAERLGYAGPEGARLAVERVKRMLAGSKRVPVNPYRYESEELLSPSNKAQLEAMHKRLRELDERDGIAT
jgi:hypothetical protein